MLGIVIAMQEEFDAVRKNAFRDVIWLSDVDTAYRVYYVRYGEKDKLAYVIISGIGKVNAAGATQYLIEHYKVSEIINAGVCGATINAFNASNTVAIERIIEADYDTSAIDGDEFKQNEVLLPTGDSMYPLYTADHFTTESEHDGYFDMEGYAVSLISARNNVDITVLKSVTDIIDAPNQTEQYTCNYISACERLGQKMSEVLRNK